MKTRNSTYFSNILLLLVLLFSLVIASCKKNPPSSPAAPVQTNTQQINGTVTVTPTPMVSATRTSTAVSASSATLTVTSTVIVTATSTATATMTSTIVVYSDAYEPDNTIDTANSIPADGTVQAHNYYGSTDGSVIDYDDFVKFTAVAGKRYMINAVAANPSMVPDFAITFFDGGQNEIEHCYEETRGGNCYYVFTCTVSGTYYADINNSDGAYGIGADYSLSVTQLPDIGGADFNGAIGSAQAFTLSGNSNWFGQTNISYDGSGAVQSGLLKNSQSCYFSTTVDPGANISFYWKVSSEDCCDNLAVYVDGINVNDIHGDQDWTLESFSVPNDASTHTVTWTYSKDGSDVYGYDAGWVDQLSVTY